MRAQLELAEVLQRRARKGYGASSRRALELGSPPTQIVGLVEPDVASLIQRAYQARRFTDAARRLQKFFRGRRADDAACRRAHTACRRAHAACRRAHAACR
eukprot:2630733-Pleurochrysis_carterae.AAC.1